MPTTDPTSGSFDTSLAAPLPERASVDDLVPVLERVRVVIAEDHPLYREAIARAIARDPRLQLIAQAGDGEEAYALALELEPDVLVLDQRMPLLDGSEVCERLQRHDPPLGIAVLMLSAYTDSDIVWRAVSHGAAGYLGKDASAEQIRDAISRLADGRLAFSHTTSRAVNDGFNQLFRRS